MDSLTGALVAAGAAWLSIIAAILLPVPEAWFQRLRWVGAASIGVVGLTLVGMPLPPGAPAVVLVMGVAAVVLWPRRRPGPRPPVAQREADALG
ncbi:MAG: hypothetical protein QOC71_1014 [Thermoplasmata archaeon]|nr:hypothetical protein [Thermoplasmata archaeon]